MDEIAEKIARKVRERIDEAETITITTGTYAHGAQYIDSYGRPQMYACFHPFIEVRINGEVVFEESPKCEDEEPEYYEEMPVLEEIIELLESEYGATLFFDDNGDLYFEKNGERIYVSSGGSFNSVHLKYTYTEIDVKKIRENFP